MIGPMPKCRDCKHYDENSPVGSLRCKAFPKGIPMRILAEGFDHTKAFPSDKGIRFEPKEG